MRKDMIYKHREWVSTTTAQLLKPGCAPVSRVICPDQVAWLPKAGQHSEHLTRMAPVPGSRLHHEAQAMQI